MAARPLIITLHAGGCTPVVLDLRRTEDVGAARCLDTVERLLRVVLDARRRGIAVQLDAAPAELCELIELLGVSQVLGVSHLLGPAEDQASRWEGSP